MTFFYILNLRSYICLRQDLQISINLKVQSNIPTPSQFLVLVKNKSKMPNQIPKIQQILTPKISSTPFFLPENTPPKNNNFGSSLSQQHLPPNKMFLIYNKNSIKDCNKDKQDKQVSVPSDNNCTVNASINQFVKSPSIVQKEVSSWLESEIKSDQPFNHTKLSMKALSLSACVKLFRPNRKRKTWKTRSATQRVKLVSYKIKSNNCKIKSETWKSKISNSKKLINKPIKIMSNSKKEPIKSSKKNSKNYCKDPSRVKNDDWLLNRIINYSNIMDYENSDMLLQQSGYSAQKKGTNLVYSWGRNQQGELAVSGSKVVSQPMPIRGFRGVVKQIGSARGHTAISNTQGHIYMAGSLLFGKIGMKAQVNNFRQFHFLTPMSQYSVKKIACGDYHTLALTEQGVLFSWGGKLWDKTGHKSDGIHKIQKLVGQQIVDIACGDFHSIAMNAEGQVYSWGGGGQNKNMGQLGHSHKKDLPQPQLIQFFKNKKAKKIACGNYHTMVLTRQQQLYAFGQGNFGQLGTGGKDDTATPKKVVLNFQVQLQQYFSSGLKQQTRVEQIALGGKHSLILTNKGHMYVCGFGSQGQLGLGQTDNKYEPVLVQSMLSKKVKMVAAGANHSLCLTQRGDVFSCGLNAKGQLGVGDERTAINWTHVVGLRGMRVDKIYSGGDHSWAVLDEFDPTIRDYQPPSPIRLNIDSINPTNRFRQQKQTSQVSSSSPVHTPIQLPNFIPSRKNNDQFINQPSTSRKLELILTEVQLSHRFIHFLFKDRLVKNSKALIDAYIDAVQKVQGDNLKFYKLNQDGDVYDQQGQLTLANNPKGLTIMLVCQLPQNARQHLVAAEGRNKIAIGDMMMMDSNMLKIDGRIPSHNFWFFKFCQMFEKQLEKVRFVQLRPKKL